MCAVVKLDKMAPATHGHNIVVKVLEKRVVMERERPNGEKLRLEECLVADDTGCMYFTARNGACARFLFLSRCALSLANGFALCVGNVLVVAKINAIVCKLGMSLR